MKRILIGLEGSGKKIGSLGLDDLAPIDGFHTRGRAATVEVAGLTDFRPTDLVLDVGCGLGGTCRHLAEQFGCRVVGIDLTEEYITVGNELSRLVGLSDLVELRQASALDLPFEDSSFDAVWTEHVQMNIADKAGFYAEISRVLKPGGRFLFHDIFRGPGDPPIYPVPWAEDASISDLADEEAARSAMDGAGLGIEHWEGKVEESTAFFRKVAARIEAEGPPPLGIHLLMGDNAGQKLENLACNLAEGRVSVAIGLAHRK